MQLKQASAEFLSGYFSTHQHRSKTKVAYSCDLSQFVTFVGEETALLSVSATIIENWAAHLHEERYSPASIRRKMVALRVFCSYWVRKGTLPESPFWRVKLSFGRIQQLPRALTEGEMRALLCQARQNYSTEKRMERQLPERISFREYRALRNLALIDLLFATGMRVGESSALDVEDFHVEGRVFRVQGKGGRDRLAFIVDEETVRIQLEHLDARKCFDTDSRALYLNTCRDRLSTQGIANILAEFRKQAGLERHITPHMLRHTVATLLLRNGADIRVVQEFLGHASIATTQRYTHITKEHLIAVLQRLHPSIALRAE